MQRLCQQPLHLLILSGALFVSAALAADELAAQGPAPTHDYPTQARVEYVNECIARHEGKLASLYQCSCVIDRMAEKLTYDKFVEAGTFAKYATLPGEGGGIFRDSDEARRLGKLYRDLEADSYRACGLQPLQ